MLRFGTMRGLTLGVVEDSRSERFKTGDVVMPISGGWADYAVIPDSAASRVHRAPGLPLTARVVRLDAYDAPRVVFPAG